MSLRGCQPDRHPAPWVIYSGAMHLFILRPQASGGRYGDDRLAQDHKGRR